MKEAGRGRALRPIADWVPALFGWGVAVKSQRSFPHCGNGAGADLTRHYLHICQVLQLVAHGDGVILQL
ncbi:hypothetical protein JZ751_029301 [Albula glossodonta]|uniref:Uncharacterized protein n=1 Tax=Albula glossodonta TaxID=121402 RepID=A0A8T2P8N9_9TELE|nr:hypothetical protein JZ751_029301 [Albula glossodonta]